MFALLAAALAAAPVVVKDPKSGVSVTLPGDKGLCVTIPAGGWDGPSCAPETKAENDAARTKLQTAETEHTRMIGYARAKSGHVVAIDASEVRPRKGKMPADFPDRMAMELISGAAVQKEDTPHEIETFNAITVLRVDFTMQIDGKPVSITSWTTLTPASDFTLTVSRGERASRWELGRAILKSLAVPEKMRVDMHGKVPIAAP